MIHVQTGTYLQDETGMATDASNLHEIVPGEITEGADLLNDLAVVVWNDTDAPVKVRCEVCEDDHRGRVRVKTVQPGDTVVFETDTLFPKRAFKVGQKCYWSLYVAAGDSAYTICYS